VFSGASEQFAVPKLVSDPLGFLTIYSAELLRAPETIPVVVKVQPRITSVNVKVKTPLANFTSAFKFQRLASRESYHKLHHCTRVGLKKKHGYSTPYLRIGFTIIQKF
jgi:hypothetical protein